MKLFRKMVGIMMILATMFCLSFAVHAAGDTMATATPISLNTTINGSITETNTCDFYSFSIPSSGRVSLSATAYMQWIYFKVYDINGNIMYDSNPTWNSTTQQINTSMSVDLTKGKYWFSVSKDGNRTGNYSFAFTFNSAEESFTETGDGTDNSLNLAHNIGFNTIYRGQIATNDSKDFYRFSMPTSGVLTLHATAKMQWIYYILYDSEGNQIWTINPTWNNVTGEIVTDDVLYLVKGDYYLAVSKDGNRTGVYSLKMNFTSSQESFTETGKDNALSGANRISVGYKYKGQLAIGDDKDFYNFVLNSDDTINLKLSADCEWLYIVLYDSSGKELKSENPRWNSVTSRIEFETENQLSAGSYYLCILKDGSRNANYSFSLNGNKPAPSPETPATSPETPISSPDLKVGQSFESNGILYTVRSATKVKVTKINSTSATVRIPNTVKVNGKSYKVNLIDRYAAKGNKYIKKLVVGKYVTGIGSGAFMNCVNLKKVTIGSAVCAISSKCFYKCKALTAIDIPAKVKSIGTQAFYGDSRLKTIIIRSELLQSGKVGKKAFSGTYSRAMVYVPSDKVGLYSKMLRKKGLNKKATMIGSL